ncbi:MAG TPA: response regulator [Candidatus Marinimicrobia bacterium]|jgi:DNA-binding response OmpR family regulator|nr:response regulator [Candidatus Neomarinimicrobiota bacterium]HIN26327.1 response regulator [Candidatus Neomarinimicrobiota bacterium]
MNSNRILIIDQDATFIQTVSSYFKSIGIEVVSSGDGIEGYRMAKEVTPGVVILDTELPNLDGFQVCRLLKGDDRYQHIPVVFVSSNDSQDFVIKSERALCDLFLRKPIVADQLTQEIITLLAPPAGEEAAIA